MQELTESQMRILETAKRSFYPSNLQELDSVKYLLGLGLLRAEGGIYKLSDEGQKYVVRRGMDGIDFFRPVS